MERPEPLNSPSAPRAANTKLGRWQRSLMREATMPTTPSWKSSWKTQSAARGSPPNCATSSSTRASASTRMPALDLAALAVDGVELARQVERALGSSVSRHSMPRVMSASRPAALMRGPSAKPRSKPWALLASRPAAEKRGQDPQLGAAASHALEALRHEAAVVGVELDDVGHGAEGHEVEQAIEPGLLGEGATRPQLAPQRQQHIEDHAHAGQGLAGKGAAGLVGVDEGIGLGSCTRPSTRAGRWWSVTRTCRPWARACSTPARLAMPLSTVTSSSGRLGCASARSTMAGVRP